MNKTWVNGDSFLEQQLLSQMVTMLAQWQHTIKIRPTVFGSQLIEQPAEHSTLSDCGVLRPKASLEVG